jgi:hypothetical protein
MDPVTRTVSARTKETPTVVKARLDTGVRIAVRSRDRKRRGTEDGNPNVMNQGKSPTLGLGVHEKFGDFSDFARGSNRRLDPVMASVNQPDPHDESTG